MSFHRHPRGTPGINEYTSEKTENRPVPSPRQSLLPAVPYPVADLPERPSSPAGRRRAAPGRLRTATARHAARFRFGMDTCQRGDERITVDPGTLKDGKYLRPSTETETPAARGAVCRTATLYSAQTGAAAAQADNRPRPPTPVQDAASCLSPESLPTVTRLPRQPHQHIYGGHALRCLTFSCEYRQKLNCGPQLLVSINRMCMPIVNEDASTSPSGLSGASCKRIMAPSCQ